MDFAEGQRVRIKDKQIVGTVEKKLTSLEDVYVVLFGEASKQEEKLVRGADLAPAPGVENQKLA